jgi:hypothetical protein
MENILERHVTDLQQCGLLDVKSAHLGSVNPTDSTSFLAVVSHNPSRDNSLHAVPRSHSERGIATSVCIDDGRCRVEGTVGDEDRKRAIKQPPVTTFLRAEFN